MNYFVTAIGTDSGKTLVSSILVEMLHADYWKPVQAGEPRDTETAKSLVSNAQSRFHEEAYLLRYPMSPHASAKIENREIGLSEIRLPTTERDLVIEGAGGVLVPLNDDEVVIDLLKWFDAEVVLVSDLYLGSINHTLLTAEELKRRKVRMKGIIFNGESNTESENIILKKTGWPVLLRIAPEEEITREVVKYYASKLKENWR